MRSKKAITKPLGEILLEQGIISREKLFEALKKQKEQPRLLGVILVQMKAVQEEDIAHCLSLQYGFPYLPLEHYEIPKNIAEIISQEIAARYCMVPIDRIENTLTVAMADPLNEEALNVLEETTQCEIQIFVSTVSDIQKTIARAYK